MKIYLLFFSFFYSCFAAAAEMAVLTIAAGEEYRDTFAMALENKREYCERHGYDFICCEENLDPSRHVYWSKILLTLEALKNPSYEWVVWMDADTLVMNSAILLEEIVDDTHDFIISKDRNGINSGVYFVRNCPSSVEFLTAVYNREDCLLKLRPEQTAIARELAKNGQFASKTKIYPQRIFNSYAEEAVNAIEQTYQPGDFILHFAGIRNGLSLRTLQEKYSAELIDDGAAFSLDQYLSCYGYELSPLHSNKNEGYISEEQRELFRERLLAAPHIQSILEVGLNGGHSAENFFRSCSNLQHFVSFDICRHAYTSVAVEYFTRKYRERFTFIRGDSKKTIPEYSSRHPGETFDLIYIDGGHSFKMAKNDILNCRKLAHTGTMLWIDDYNTSIKKAVDTLEKQGVIVIDAVRSTSGLRGKRCWVEARYL